MKLKRFYVRLMRPQGEGDGGGGTVDRGDNFTPTGEDAIVEDETPAPKKTAPEANNAPEDASDVDPENPDADTDPAPAAEPDPKKKDSRIPLSRHKEILAREREQRQIAEERLAQYQKGSEVAAVNEDITKLEDNVLALEKQYTKLLGDGELDKATEVMGKIRVAERQISEAKNDFKLQAAVAQATEQARYDIALERVEEAYPVLNPDHDDFDKAKLGEVVEWKIFYERQRNMTPTKALQAAVKKIVGTETKAQSQATTVAPKVDAEEVAKDVAKDRKKAAVAKTVEATGKTPASTTKVGMDGDKAGGSLTAKDVMKMSQEDFRKLPDDVLARMRGDEFV